VDEVANAGNGEVAEQTSSPEAVTSPYTDREAWLDTMADAEIRNDRRYKSVNRRLDRLESRARIISLPEEMKTFLVMTGISVAAAILVPLVQGMVEKWRRQQ
jgi:hypothetical protein